MKVNADGSVDLYLSERPPKGLKGNWIPTCGRDFFLFFRFCGPEKQWLIGATSCLMSS
jgi:hypothetical protein